MKSIFDVIKDFYGNPINTNQDPPLINWINNRVFIHERIRKDLKTHEKMIVFSFMMRFTNETEI